MNDDVIVLRLEGVGERLDKALAEALPSYSRTQCQRLIEEGHVQINEQPVRAAQRITGGELATITIPRVQEIDLLPEPIPIDIRYEDDDLLLINKPTGMVVHPSAGHEGGTLVNAVLAHVSELPGIGGERRPGIVHRLDKDTSGLILVAKNDHALQYLQDQFRRREIRKVYLALVDGHFSQNNVLIDAPIGRDPRNRKQMTVITPGSSTHARPAQTAVAVLGYYSLIGGSQTQPTGEFSLLECRPKTGRTHQIRVHLSFAGFPITGDQTYGLRRQRIELGRHFLHASSLTFRRPSDGLEMTHTISLPGDLQVVLDSLKRL